MFGFAYKFDFSYTVDENEIISIASSEFTKLMDTPEIAQAIHHFVDEIAVKGTAYAIYFDVEKNKFGRTRITNQTVYPQV